MGFFCGVKSKKPALVTMLDTTKKQHRDVLFILPEIRQVKDLQDTPAGGNTITQKSFVVLGDGRGQRSCSTDRACFPSPQDFFFYKD